MAFERVLRSFCRACVRICTSLRSISSAAMRAVASRKPRAARRCAVSSSWPRISFGSSMRVTLGDLMWLVHRASIALVDVGVPVLDVIRFNRTHEVFDDARDLVRRVEEFHHHRQVQRQLHEPRRLNVARIAEAGDAAKHGNAAHHLPIMKPTQQTDEQRDQNKEKKAHHRHFYRFHIRLPATTPSHPAARQRLTLRMMFTMAFACSPSSNSNRVSIENDE